MGCHVYRETAAGFILVAVRCIGLRAQCKKGETQLGTHDWAIFRRHEQLTLDNLQADSHDAAAAQVITLPPKLWHKQLVRHIIALLADNVITPAPPQKYSSRNRRERGFDVGTVSSIALMRKNGGMKRDTPIRVTVVHERARENHGAECH